MVNEGTETGGNRRPLATRSRRWAQGLAARVARTPLTPDQISLLGIVFAAIGAALLVSSSTWLGLLACAATIQLRLLCNMLDGMVAVEGGKKSAVGLLYNEIPDRVEDSLLIVALGYAVAVPWLGWLGALAAASTAYLRALGGALGFPQDFRGPLAKPHRMAVMTGACIAGAIERATAGTSHALLAGAAIVAIGSLVTCVTRTRALAARLRGPRA